MKSRFPSGISGWRAQGPRTPSRAARPPRRPQEAGIELTAPKPQNARKYMHFG